MYEKDLQKCHQWWVNSGHSPRDPIQNAESVDHQKKPENTWCRQLTEELCSDSVDPKLACNLASGEGNLLQCSSSSRWATGARSLTEDTRRSWAVWSKGTLQQAWLSNYANVTGCDGLSWMLTVVTPVTWIFWVLAVAALAGTYDMVLVDVEASVSVMVWDGSFRFLDLPSFSKNLFISLNSGLCGAQCATIKGIWECSRLHKICSSFSTTLVPPRSNIEAWVPCITSCSQNLSPLGPLCLNSVFILPDCEPRI